MGKSNSSCAHDLFHGVGNPIRQDLESNMHMWC